MLWGKHLLPSYKCRNYSSERQGKSTTHDLTGRSCNLKSCSHSPKLKIPLPLGFDIPGIPGLLPGLAHTKQSESLPSRPPVSWELPSQQLLLRGTAYPTFLLCPHSDQDSWGRGTRYQFPRNPRDRRCHDITVSYFSSSVQFQPQQKERLAISCSRCLFPDRHYLCNDRNLRTAKAPVQAADIGPERFSELILAGQGSLNSEPGLNAN